MYDVEPGIYYVTAYTYVKANDFTIVASMSFEPLNIEPEDAIELTPSIPYGPISGYDGLNQFFKINVNDGIERLEIDLNDGFGEASLFVKLADSPSTSDFTYRSNSPGSGDKIGFNDPTPGTWYILVSTEMVFGEVTITASFTDRYVWDYDGTPIQLFNGEEVTGIEAPSGESLNFFVELSQPAEYLMIQTFGGVGDLTMNVNGDIMVFAFDDFFEIFEEDEFMKEGERQAPGNNFESDELFIKKFDNDLCNNLINDFNKFISKENLQKVNKISVSIGPANFNASRLIVVLARTISQQINCPLESFSSFEIMAKRIATKNSIFTNQQSFWIYKKLKRKGFIAGKYEICQNEKNKSDLLIRETVLPKVVEEIEDKELFLEAIYDDKEDLKELLN
ncbi:MAG: pre-peptidase C-terminal domain-containing protein, partial [Candidatus Thermoplasmatota archaeon]|nr:pre-peptidase C-terminal domain-containing protein [Candidatus Thermoplasmatota archaeon]